MNQISGQSETKIGRLTLRACEIASSGVAPEEAWIRSIVEEYPPDRRDNQLRHTCPKGAFSGLCHAGHVSGVQIRRSIEGATGRSAQFAVKALEELRIDPSLAENKTELKRRVFGEKTSPGYRTPNGEIDVLLVLWGAGLIRK